MKPVLYLLAGLLCDAAIWSEQIAAFDADYDVRVPDFTSFTSLSAMAASVLETAPLRFALAGHSMGARVALEVFRQAPERIERLALLDTGTHPVQPGEAEKRQILVDLAQTQGMEALTRHWLTPMVAAEHRRDAALMDALRAMVLRMSPEIYLNQVTALLGRADAGPLLGQIACPVLVGVGRHDAWSPPAQHAPIAAAIPGARYVVFEDAGHMAPLEAPAAVTQALRDWLAQPLDVA
ncbi:MAG: alpha/beta fold hydrolase [Caulobacteraceae bacterium]